MTTYTTTVKAPDKRRYRVEGWLIGKDGGHAGKRTIDIEAFNRNDAFAVARRMGYSPIRIV